MSQVPFDFSSVLILEIYGGSDFLGATAPTAMGSVGVSHAEIALIVILAMITK